MTEVIPRSKNSFLSLSFHFDVKELIFDARKTYCFDECDKIDAVTTVNFFRCSMPSVPKIINWSQFPNLRHLDISTSNLMKIKRSDLKGLEKIKSIRLNHNNLEYLPGDLFDDMESLESASFYNNNIKYIGEELVNFFKKFKFLNLHMNVNINEFYRENDRHSSSMEDIVKEVLEKCKVPEEYKENLKLLEDYSNDAKNCKFSDFENLLKNEDTKDFTVVIEDRHFRVHKFLLLARSPQLSKMIQEDPEKMQLQLSDVPIDIFEIIVSFLYDDYMPPEDADFKEIFIACGRLEIELLKNYAAAKLIEQINEKNAFELAMLTIEYKHERLHVKAFEEIKKMFPDKALNEKLADDPDKLKKLSELRERRVDFERKFNQDFNQLQNVFSL